MSGDITKWTNLKNQKKENDEPKEKQIFIEQKQKLKVYEKGLTFTKFRLN